MSPDANATLEHLEKLYGGLTDGWLSIFAQHPKTREERPAWHRITELADAADTMARLSTEGWNVWYAQGIQAQRLPAPERGKTAGVIALPGLWFDLDIAGPNHKQTALPATMDDALDLIFAAVPFPPSRIVHSGGGLYPLWLFHEPQTIESDAERHALKSMSKRFQRRLIEEGKRRGYRLDSTPDLPRPLRAPGTLNHKSDPPQLVRILPESEWRR
jgi:putative DNA primase/helicase